MLARLSMCAVLLAGTLVGAVTTPQRVYLVTWGADRHGSAESRALIAQADRQLREELRRRGAAVIEGQATRAAIVLKPSLEILPGALKLNLVGVRDQKLLGTISTRAAGSSRNAQLRAIVGRACLEADQL